MKLLSIIIPVYKVEKYIRQCLTSIFSQDMDDLNFEVICVNDGTPDGSMEIVSEFASKYKEIKIISQKNQGLSVARNVGLLQAEGKYVWFVDSDDWISSDSFRILYPHLCQEYDGICIGYKRSGKISSEHRLNFHKNSCVSGIDLLKSSSWTWIVGAVFTIYMREFLIGNSFKFCPGLLHEDCEFTPRVYYYARKMYVLGEPIYIYRENTSSITHSVNAKRKYDLLLTIEKLHHFMKSEVKSDEVLPFHRFISNLINAAIVASLYEDKVEQNKFAKIIDKHKRMLSWHYFSSLNIKYMIEAVILMLSSQMFIYTFKRLK